MQTVGTPGLWAGFIVFVLLMLALDLGVFHRKAHAVGFKEALGWSVVWISLALLFGAGVWWWFGPQLGAEYLTGYVVEKSLSVDNIFVFVVIFAALRIPALLQHRVLFWGILTALILRAVMILAGAALLERFHWLIYLFGAFLLFTAVKLFLAFRKGEEEHPEDGFAARMLKKVLPTSDKLDGERFFTVENGRRVATPLLTALLLVEVTDVIFAVDSIPAVFAVSRDPFVVFTSNIFAILGLRSLFFLLAGMMEKFRYLKPGLAAVLLFVGGKMLLIDFVKIPPFISLGVILAILGVAVVASLLAARGAPTAPAAPQPGQPT